MKKFNYRFRSIMVNNLEKIIPGTAYKRMVIDMDENTIEQHSIELTLKDIIHDKSWTLNFLLAVMVVGGISAMIFGIVYLNFSKIMEQSRWANFTWTYTTVTVFIFILLWIFLSFRSSVANKKRDYIYKTRGKGNWRIVDESNWENFYRLLMISKKKNE
jgi:hypothetical protein